MRRLISAILSSLVLALGCGNEKTVADIAPEFCQKGLEVAALPTTDADVNQCVRSAISDCGLQDVESYLSYFNCMLNPNTIVPCKQPEGHSLALCILALNNPGVRN